MFLAFDFLYVSFFGFIFWYVLLLNLNNGTPFVPLTCMHTNTFCGKLQEMAWLWSSSSWSLCFLHTYLSHSHAHHTHTNISCANSMMQLDALPQMIVHRLIVLLLIKLTVKEEYNLCILFVIYILSGAAVGVAVWTIIIMMYASRALQLIWTHTKNLFETSSGSVWIIWSRKVENHLNESTVLYSLCLGSVLFLRRLHLRYTAACSFFYTAACLSVYKTRYFFDFFKPFVSVS